MLFTLCYCNDILRLVKFVWDFYIKKVLFGQNNVQWEIAHSVNTPTLVTYFQMKVMISLVIVHLTMWPEKNRQMSIKEAQ